MSMLMVIRKRSGDSPCNSFFNKNNRWCGISRVPRGRCRRSGEPYFTDNAGIQYDALQITLDKDYYIRANPESAELINK